MRVGPVQFADADVDILGTAFFAFSPGFAFNPEGKRLGVKPLAAGPARDIVEFDEDFGLGKTAGKCQRRRERAEFDPFVHLITTSCVTVKK